MTENRQLLLPLWLAHPELERSSAGWQAGAGKDDLIKWKKWYETLSGEEAARYQELFPEPPAWKGFWHENDDCIYYTRGEFRIALWQKGGAAKYSLEQLRKEYRMGKRFKYCMFWKPQTGKGCLSQWQTSPFVCGTQHYCCMEQYMMAQKALLFGDEEMRQRILSSKSPQRIKALGQQVQHFNESIWKQTKYAIILNGNYLKFSQNPQLKNFLLQTGNKVLVEASPYDGIWGIKMAETDKTAQNPLKWNGQNLLGFALMEVRDVLREVCKNESLALTDVPAQ